MSQNDPRQRYADIFPENANDPDLERLIHDLDAVMNAPVLSEQQGLAQTAQPDFAGIPISHPLQQGHANRPPQRHIGPWMGAVAALLVVSLLSGLFLSRMHEAPGQTSTGYHQFSQAKGACAPGDIKTHLPANSDIGPLSMVSPDEGWAIGAIVDITNGTPAKALMLHYAHCTWTPVSISYPNAALSGISMGSATDGWAVGNVNSVSPLALHYTHGNWTRETLPGENELDGHGIYSAVDMFSATEGWIVINHEKDSHGLLTNGLLHLSNGHWSTVDAPLPGVEAVLPVAANEAWIAGSASKLDEIPVLYHYQAGTWSKVTIPAGVLIDHLRMVSPNDIWATGRTFPLVSQIDQSAAVLHYDGASWTRVNLGSASQAQIVDVFNAHEGWAFTLTSTAQQQTEPVTSHTVISRVQFGDGTSWQTVSWPFKDLEIDSLERVAPDEYWAIGSYGVDVLTPTGNGSYSGFGYGVSVLLYFADGSWHEYGR